MTRLLLAALLGWLALAMYALVANAPLGHDEAAYALMSQDATMAEHWLYRSPGSIAIARVAILVGTQEWQLRLVSVFLNVLALLGVYAAGRAAFSPRTAGWAALVIAGAHPMVLHNAVLLGDFPAMACVMFGIALLVTELAREEGPRWRIVAAGPLFAASFYIRYGSAPVVAIAVLLAIPLYGRSIRVRPAPFVAMVGALVVALVPHFAASYAATGSVVGIVEHSSGVPRSAYVGEGLVSYLSENPLHLYGVLVAPVMLAALAGFVRVRRRVPRAAWYFTGIALAQIVVLGLNNHATSRYVYTATALLVVVGVDHLRHHVPMTHGREISLALVALAWLGVAIASVPHQRALARLRAPVIVAAEALRANAPAGPCVLVARAIPQLQWYARCEVIAERLLEGDPLPTDRPLYAASLPGRFGVDLVGLAAAQRLVGVALPTRDPRVQVWRLEKR